MLHFSTPKISLQGALKNAQYCNENDAFYTELIMHLTMQSRGAPEGTFHSALKDTLSDIHKDAQEGAYGVALKGALEVALELRCTKRCN